MRAEQHHFPRAPTLNQLRSTRDDPIKAREWLVQKNKLRIMQQAAMISTSAHAFRIARIDGADRRAAETTSASPQCAQLPVSAVRSRKLRHHRQYSIAEDAYKDTALRT